MGDRIPQIMQLLEEADKLLNHLQLHYPQEIHDAIEYKLNAIYKRIADLEKEQE